MNRQLLLNQTHPPQGGFALVIGLLLLVVMSILGVSMMGTTRLDTLMAGGTREANIAFEAAEAALRDAEARISATTSIARDFDGTTPGQLDAAAPEPDYFAPATWSEAGSRPYSTGYYADIPQERQPRYIIKHIGDILEDEASGRRISINGYGRDPGGAVSIFRITARGTSRDGSATTLLQSHFGKRYP